MKEKIFTEIDYNSNDGMVTYIWGPPFWHVLHTISFNYPIKPTKENKDNYLEYFTSLKNILPCGNCRKNYEQNLKILPITQKVLKNRDSLSLWLYNMHELVNTHLEKKSGLSYDEVRERYEQFRSRCLIDTVKNDKGCVQPLYGIKSKCVLNIIPRSVRCDSIKIDKKSRIKKIILK